MGVCQRETRHILVLGEARDHAGVQEGSTHPKEKRILNMCLISRVSLRKVFQTQG